MSRDRDEDRYAALRGPADPTIANMIRWERIKLWAAAQDALALIEAHAPSTPDVAEALWGDGEFTELRQLMRKHRSRIAELRTMQDEAEVPLADGFAQPE